MNCLEEIYTEFLKGRDQPRRPQAFQGSYGNNAVLNVFDNGANGKRLAIIGRIAMGPRDQKRIAQPLPHKPAHQFQRRRGETDLGRNPLAFQQPREIGAAGQDIEQDKRLVCQVMQRNPLFPGQAVIGIEQHIGLQPRKFSHLQVVLQVQRVEQHKVIMSGAQAREELFLRPFLQFYPRLWMLRLKARNEFWRIDGGDGRKTADGEFAFHQHARHGGIPLKIIAMGNKAAGFV